MYKQYYTKFIRYYSNPCKNRSKNVRVRFAPSPTGYLHLGGLRTALYNFLFAQRHSGKFILRIEDTDQTRLIEGASEQLYNDLIWSGINIDEGPSIGGPHNPYTQSERIDLYRVVGGDEIVEETKLEREVYTMMSYRLTFILQAPTETCQPVAILQNFPNPLYISTTKHDQIKTLLDNGTAYYCFCTTKRLELLRKESLRIRQTPKYDNRCRHLTKNEVLTKLKKGDAYCIRFKLSPDINAFQDIVYGNISYDITLTEGDPIIIKTDGYPTYHFANVVDDHFMEISHVLRGVEWQVSTTKHLMMYRAFGWDPPIYGHLPLLMNPDGTKLSKRQGDIQITHYRDSGILPQALVNFITSSGGGFEKDQLRNVKSKCHTMDELVNQFDVTKINVSSGKLKSERLEEFNRLEIQRLLQNPTDQKVLIERLKLLIKNTLHTKNGEVLVTDTLYIQDILNWATHRITKLSDLVSKDFMFLWIVPNYEKEGFKSEQVEMILKVDRVIKDLNLDKWSKDGINEMLRSIANEDNFQYTKLMKLLRGALSGLKEGPSVAEMMHILGKENTRDRLKIYLDKQRRN